MGDGTHIEWTDATWNIVNGCSVISPGCTNCYAMRLAGTRLKHHASRKGLTIDTKALDYFEAANCACTAAERYVPTCPKHGTLSHKGDHP
jgi:protein gp37